MQLGGLGFVRDVPKIQEFHPAIEVFDHRGEAFNPITAIVVGDAFDFPDGRGVDVAAKHGIDAVVAREANDGLLEFPDKADDIFHLGFHIGAERPVPEAEEAAEKIHQAVAAHEQDIANVAEMGEPAEVLDDGVEFVAVDHQDFAAVGGGVDRVFAKFHTRVVPVEGGKEFVVVADDVNDFRALAAVNATCRPDLGTRS